jgi:YegS/Rv2252/BmrU family lipid kinase
MSDLRVRIILNPNAAGGRAAKKLPEIVATFERFDIRHDLALTQGPGDATRLAQKAFHDNIDLIAVVGGDGTLNEVSQAYIDERGVPCDGPELALIPIGTGGDFKRTCELSGELEQAVARIRNATTRLIDLPIMRLVSFDGKDIVRAFINVTSFGVGGVTDKLVNDTPKWMGGKAAFLIGSARALAQYRNARVQVFVDGATFVDCPVFNVAIANGKYFGGGMMIAPQADPSDGLLEVVSMGDLGIAQSLLLSSKIYKGQHVGLRDVKCTRGKRIEAIPRSDQPPVLIDMDGETPGKLPVSIELAPRHVRLRA